MRLVDTDEISAAVADSEHTEAWLQGHNDAFTFAGYDPAKWGAKDYDREWEEALKVRCG